MSYPTAEAAWAAADRLNRRRGHPKARAVWVGYWTVIASYAYGISGQ